MHGHRLIWIIGLLCACRCDDRATKALLESVKADFQKTRTAEAAAEPPGFLWEVSNEKGRAFLLGSVRVLDANVYPLPANIERAFDESNVLAVELNTDDAPTFEKLKETYQKAAFCPSGDGLSAHLSAATYHDLQTMMAKHGLSPSGMERLRPKAAAQTLFETSMKIEGFDFKLSMHKHFLKRALETRKPIVEMYSMQELADDMAFETGEPDAVIRIAMDEYDRNGADVAAAQKAFVTGKTADLKADWEQFFQRHPEGKEMFRRSVTHSNDIIVPMLEDYIASRRTHFVVLMAAGLAAPGGILEVLREKGYQITRR